jgi:hypothetical protein
MIEKQEILKMTKVFKFEELKPIIFTVKEDYITAVVYDGNVLTRKNFRKEVLPAAVGEQRQVYLADFNSLSGEDFFKDVFSREPDGQPIPQFKGCSLDDREGIGFSFYTGRPYLIKALQRAKSFADTGEDKLKIVTFSFEKKICTLSAEGIGGGRISKKCAEEVTVEGEGEKGVSHYNADYLLKILPLSEAKIVELLFFGKKENHILRIDLLDAEHTMGYIMPIRINLPWSPKMKGVKL